MGRGDRSIDPPDREDLGRSTTTGLHRCDGDDSSYFGGCEAPSRFHIERQGDPSYGPVEACPAHVANALASMADGDNVPLIVHVRLDGGPDA